MYGLENQSFFENKSFSPLKLSASSTFQINEKEIPYDVAKRRAFGTFKWFSGEVYEGEISKGRRNGFGKQVWKDGSTYVGNYVNDLKHGKGNITWYSGEEYEGYFYKDNLHGKGCYKWPDGSKFIGSFYKNKKEGYGTFFFNNGNKFEGLYKQNERFGPGVLHYKDEENVKDLGIWHRKRLLRVCGAIKNVFSINRHPNYSNLIDEDLFQDDSLSAIENYDEIEFDLFKISLKSSKELIQDETVILPNGIESYCRDFDHLPTSKLHRKEWDEAFSCSDERSLENKSNYVDQSLINKTPLSIKIHNHMNQHQNLPWSFDANRLMVKQRDEFESMPGKLETVSLQLIQSSSEGDYQTVLGILKSGLIDPNVSEKSGNFALIQAATNLHQNIVHLLLDFGANVNQLNDEGMSTLNACLIYYYPTDHFKPNKAQQYIKNYYQFLERINNDDNNIKKKQDNQSKLPEIESDLDYSEDEKPFSSEKRILEHYRLYKMGELSETTDLEETNDEEDNLRSISRMSVNSSLQNTTKVSEWKFFASTANVVKLENKVTEELINKTAEILSHNDRAVDGLTCRDTEIKNRGTLRTLAVYKSERMKRKAMIATLLERGANPNSKSLPFYPIFFAVKCGDYEILKLLLERGASPEVKLSKKKGGLTPLHIACSIESPDGPRLVELLLKAKADPNIAACDKHISYKMANGEFPVHESVKDAALSHDSYPLSNLLWDTKDLNFVDSGGRTALHIACDRDDDYESTQKIIHLLLSNGANPNVLWSGHSPFSIAAASGNDLAIDELIKFGADPNLPLLHSLGNLICVACDPKYEYRRSNKDLLKLINKLINAGANVLSPVAFGTNKQVGNVVDYVYWKQSEDKKIANTPYHALTYQERKIYDSRNALLRNLSKIVRNAAIKRERERRMTDSRNGINTRSPSRGQQFLYTGAGASLQSHSSGEKSSQAVRKLTTGIESQTSVLSPTSNKSTDVKSEEIRKPLFKYCYNCGRSVGVRLQPCPRCGEVYYCSRSCKLSAWDAFHKKECKRVKITSLNNSLPSEVESSELFQERSLEDPMSRAESKTTAVINSVLDRNVVVAELNRVSVSRQYGLSLMSKSGLNLNSLLKTQTATTTKLPNITRTAPENTKRTAPAKTKRTISGRPARPFVKMTKDMKKKVGKKVEWDTDGTTLHYLDSNENYSFI